MDNCSIFPGAKLKSGECVVFGMRMSSQQSLGMVFTNY
jgi:hypothetical protein